MPLPPEPLGPGAGLGAQQLASATSFGARDRLLLPFDLQRSRLFLSVLALVVTAIVAAATGIKPVLGVGLVLAVGIAILVASNELIGLVLLAALAASTSGLAKGIPLPGVRFSQVLIGGIGAVLLLSARRYVRWSAFDWAALAYAAATAVLGGWDLVTSGQPFGQGQLNLLFGPLQFLLLYRVTLVCAHTSERRRLVLRIMLLASVPVAILAIGQQFNFPGFRQLIVTLTANDVYAAGSTARATGPFPLWHNLGGYLFVLMLAMAALDLNHVRGVLSRRVMAVIFVIDAIALLETLDIAPILSLLAGIIILGVWLGGLNRVLLGLAAIIVVALLVFGGRIDARVGQEFNRSAGTQRSALVPQTVQYRVDLWTGTLLPLLKGHVASGYGPNLPAVLADFPYTESQYLTLLYRGGVALLGVWALMFFLMGAAGLRTARGPDPLQRSLGAAVAVAVLCLLFISFIESYFTDDGTPQVLWMLLGLLTFHEPISTHLRTQVTHGMRITRQRAFDANVEMSLVSLDVASRELLLLSSRPGTTDDELVRAMGLTPPALRQWRTAAIDRLAQHASMDPADCEHALCSMAVREPQSVVAGRR